ncbi:MAG: DNA-processing protein DprA [Eubacterium sp.]|nr:DNA-processing protein DprA [Eubacterium sp.]
MSENAIYWLWLQRALGEGARFKEILEDFKGIKEFYNANILEWRMSPALVPKQINKLEEISLNDVEHIIYTCEQNGWQIIDYDDKNYPERLREIPNPPAVLFVEGDFAEIDDSVVIGVVGTRRASEYAVQVTELLCRGISESGAVVVSGGALGVDSAAHRGAILCGGKTIAVLGCGFGTSYLMGNKNLRDSIKQNGALITEFPPFTGATKYTFPLRNRIISGLSLGVLVVEASVKSGSLITARCAAEQNRDIYAVPCSILSPEFAGTNKLIEDGAMVVTKPADLLSPYAERFHIDLSKVKSVDKLMHETVDISANFKDNKADKLSFENLENGRSKREKREKAALSLSGNTKIVYEALTESLQHIDVITEKCSLPVSSVMGALTALEIADLAVSASGKRYKLS